MAQAKPDYITPFDTLGMRLHQAQGALTAVQVTYDDDYGYQLTPAPMRDALDAVHELIAQAQTCYETLAHAGIVTVASQATMQ